MSLESGFASALCSYIRYNCSARTSYVTNFINHIASPFCSRFAAIDGLRLLTPDHPASGTLFCFIQGVVEIAHRVVHNLNCHRPEGHIKGFPLSCSLRVIPGNGRTISMAACAMTARVTRPALARMLGGRVLPLPMSTSVTRADQGNTNATNPSNHRALL
ncbi:hypothetical protein [Rhizobium leguminosarum]|uniref:hypothetical protein n=1 Tax=Rhizobium leguminosarum TaxID=384 RepID=UPI00143F3209|nr:hypothetical protein [Rhizobium leguminosarum]